MPQIYVGGALLVDDLDDWDFVDCSAELFKCRRFSLSSRIAFKSWGCGVRSPIRAA